MVAFIIVTETEDQVFFLFFFSCFCFEDQVLSTKNCWDRSQTKLLGRVLRHQTMLQLAMPNDLFSKQ